MCIYRSAATGYKGRKHVSNILVVWLLTGIWHGASWNFVAMGRSTTVFCCCMEKFVFGRWLEKLPAVFRHIYCMFFVMLGWNLFVFEDLRSGIAYLKALFGLYGQGLVRHGRRFTCCTTMQYCLLLLILGSTHLSGAAAESGSAAKLEDRAAGAHDAAKSCFTSAFFCYRSHFWSTRSYNPFLYFRF